MLVSGVWYAYLTMLVIQSSLDIVDGGVGHTALIQNLQPLFCRLCSCLRFDHSFQCDPIFDPDIVRDESFIRLPFGLSDFVAKHAEQAIVAATEEDVTITGFEGLVGDDGRCDLLIFGMSARRGVGRTVRCAPPS